MKQTARTKQYGGATKEIQNAVGAGALDSPLYINVFSGRRRRRPLPRYRETVHFFSAKWLCEHNTGGCKHTPLRSVASLLRKHCPSPTEVERDPFVCAPPKDGANNVTAGASPRPTEVCERPFVCAKPQNSANKETDTSSVSLRLPPSPTGEGFW